MMANRPIDTPNHGAAGVEGDRNIGKKVTLARQRRSIKRIEMHQLHSFLYFPIPIAITFEMQQRDFAIHQRARKHVLGAEFSVEGAPRRRSVGMLETAG